MLTVKPFKHPVKETACSKSMNSNTQLAFLTACLHSGGLDRVVEDAHGVINLINEAPPSVSQPNPARIAVEEGNAKIVL